MGRKDSSTRDDVSGGKLLIGARVENARPTTARISLNNSYSRDSLRTMSFLGIDLLDNVPWVRYTSDDESPDGHRSSVASRSHGISDPSTITSASSTEEQAPIPWIEVTQPIFIEDNETEEGITILSSIPSRHLPRFLKPYAPPRRATNSPPTLSPNAGTILASSPALDQAVLSISTTESVFVDQEHLGLSPCSSLLSLNPSSLATVEDFSLADCSSGRSDKEESRSSNGSVARPESPVRPKWFEKLKSEKDWESFSKETRETLDALGDEVDEETLARLIQQEEHLLWEATLEERRARMRQRDLSLRRQLYLAEALVFFSATAASLGAFRFVRR